MGGKGERGVQHKNALQELAYVYSRERISPEHVPKGGWTGEKEKKKGSIPDRWGTPSSLQLGGGIADGNI